MPERSEAAAWKKVRDIADGVRRSDADRRSHGIDSEWIKDGGQILFELAGTMLAQLKHGIHKNPALAIWGNPPNRDHWLVLKLDRKLSSEVHAIRYNHRTDHKNYQHDFDPGVDMVTAVTEDGQRVIVILARDGREIWEDF